MKTTRIRLILFAAIALRGASGLALAEKPLKDYSFIRGVNYGMRGDTAVLERDLGYAKRLNLDSTRIWLSYQHYERDPQGYIDRLRNYIRTSHRLWKVKTAAEVDWEKGSPISALVNGQNVVCSGFFAG